MSNIGCLLSAWSWLLTLSRKYTQISSEPERKANTVFFGVYSIVMSILMAGLFVLCAWGIYALADALDSSGLGVLLMWVFIAILFLCALTILAEHIFGGFMGIIYQFRCNRKPIGYVAIVVFILATVGMILGVIYALGLVGG